MNIRALLLLVVFLLGTIGVNVSKVYCHRCQETYSRLIFIPADTPCPCTHGCVCCHSCHNMHKKNCDNAKQQHTYYKVYGEWVASHFEVQFSDMVMEVDSAPVFSDRATSIVKSFNPALTYTDNSPPLELLCTFRC